MVTEKMVLFPSIAIPLLTPSLALSVGFFPPNRVSGALPSFITELQGQAYGGQALSSFITYP